jgi:hypothetical protein
LWQLLRSLVGEHRRNMNRFLIEKSL